MRYWTFDTELLNPPDPNPAKLTKPKLVKSRSDSGDECHHTIHDISDSRAKKLFYDRVADGHIGLCVDGKYVEYSCQRAGQLKQEHFPGPR